MQEAIGAAFVERAGDLVPTSSVPEAKYPQFVKDMRRTFEQCKALRNAYHGVVNNPAMDFYKDLDVPFAAYSNHDYEVARPACKAVNALMADLSVSYPASMSKDAANHIFDSFAKFETAYVGGVSKINEKRAGKAEFLTSNNFQSRVAQQRLEQSVEYLLANTNMKPKDITKLSKGFIKKHEAKSEELPILF